ncbi:MAG: hypothetical protein WA208_01850 [Thermoanaerobaculia bacterium]
MNLAELAESLPNGLHDAELARWTVDYVARTAVLELELWVATDDSPRELYRPARLTLSGVEYLVIEPPDPTYPFQGSKSITIDLSSEATEFVPQAGAGTAFRLFVAEWNSFICGAASRAELEWVGPAAPRVAPDIKTQLQR